jgi:hypothetical protein
MKPAIKVLIMYTAIALLFIACSDPTAEEGDTVIIYLGSSTNSRAAAGSAFNPDGTTFHSKITYKIEIYDPDGNYVIDKSGQGGSAISITLDPGSYYLTAEAKYNGMDYAEIILSPGDDYIEFNTSEKTVTVPMRVIQPVFYDAGQLTEIPAYLSSPYPWWNNTVYLVGIELNSNWGSIIGAFDNGPTNIELDLSDCSVSGDVFKPAGAGAGTNAIKEITLPTYALFSIEGGFTGFTSLKQITAKAVTNIGDDAFSGLTALQQVNFSSDVTNIGNRAFANCTNLSFTTDFYNVKIIGDNAFQNCSSLGSVDFREVTTIGAEAFSGATSLGLLTIPKVTSIGKQAFMYTGGHSLEIQMGPTPPVLGEYLFDVVLTTKQVTIMPTNASASATDYGPVYPNPGFTYTAGTPSGIPWVEGLKGEGWDGTALGGNANSNITVTIYEY